MQSALHVAIIMDGNGRWATARRRPRAFGHHKGAEATRKVVEVAPRLGIGTLTLYAFSADNWQRPQPEVDELMRLFEKYLRSETATFVSNGIRLSIVGRRDRIAPALRQTMAAAEKLMRQAQIPYLDSTTKSIEEIATHMLHEAHLVRRVY